MRYCLLGPFTVTDESGRDITPRALKPRALLAILCANVGRVVTSAELVETIWSFEPPRTASTALHVYVSSLRKQLGQDGEGAGLIETRQPGYRLAERPEAVDKGRFDGLINESREQEALGDLAGAAELTSEALDLWTGHALADLKQVPRLGSLARQLEETRNLAYERWVQLEIELGHHDRTIGVLQGLVDRQPLSENPYQYLMLALYRTGRVSDALAVYQRLRLALVAELGLEPSVHLKALHHGVLTRAPWLDAPALALPYRFQRPALSS